MLVESNNLASCVKRARAASRARPEGRGGRRPPEGRGRSRTSRSRGGPPRERIPAAGTRARARGGLTETALERRTAFDALAERWDAGKAPEAIASGVEKGLALLGDLEGLSVVDLGAGPGRIEPFLLPRLGAGAVVAVDFSPAMVARGAARVADPRVTWLCRDVLDTGLGDSSADVVLCFNAFPHFPDPRAVLREAARWLRPGGRLLLWHDLGRARLAEVHRRTGGAVGDDLLPPVTSLAGAARDAGLLVERAAEDDSSYTLLARRPA